VAADITARVNKEHEEESMLAAISRSMAVIEFTPEGNVISANDNFLRTMQYSLNEIVGHHHSLFCHRAESESAQYKAFWASLNRGEYHSHRFERTSRGRWFISKPRTTRCSTPRAACTKWSSSPATSPIR
jgi:methyl-accepting chemotaxis protein